MIFAGIAWIFWVLRVARLMRPVRWSSLRITGSGPGTPAEERVKGSMHELSRFEKVGGAWFYVDGDVR